MRGHNSILDI